VRALLGVLNQDGIADTISRKPSIVVAVVVSTIGSVLQTARGNHAMLVVARLLELGRYISEIFPPEIRPDSLLWEELSIVTSIAIAYWIIIEFVTWLLNGLGGCLPSSSVSPAMLGAGILFLQFSEAEKADSF